ncbi:MAG TPA: hypothetical protein VM737_01555 [Gemmatimonadota bacterium]|nr:hypothetical protein [Gemmatimonadota bacterium]
MSVRLPPWKRAWPMIVVLTTLPCPARAQDADGPSIGSAPYMAAMAETARDAIRRETEVVHAVDIGDRFEEFQRDFEEDFGGKSTGDDELKAAAEKIGKALEKRWAGSATYRLYRRLEGVYERAEGFYERLERSTRWTTHGVEVDPDLESAVDGKLGLHVRRKIGTFDLGLDVNDAIDGRFGLRLGGRLGRYQVSFDAADIIADRRLSFQLRQVTR